MEDIKQNMMEHVHDAQSVTMHNLNYFMDELAHHELEEKERLAISANLAIAAAIQTNTSTHIEMAQNQQRLQIDSESSMEAKMDELIESVEGCHE